MEIPCVSLSQASKKVMFFFYLLFFFYKIGEQEGQKSSVGGGEEALHHWEGEVMGKGGRRMNRVQIMCTHVSKCENDTY
jgi:hypothetical protein